MAAKTAHKKIIRAGASFELFAPISSRSICEMLANFSGIEFKRLYLISGKEKLFFFLCSRRSYTELEIRRFHAVFVQQRQRNVNKREARVKMLFC